MKLVSTWLNTKKKQLNQLTIIQTWSWLSTTINHHYKLDIYIYMNHYQPATNRFRFTTTIPFFSWSQPSPCLVALEILLAIARLVLSPISWHLRGRRRQQISSQVIQSQPKKHGKGLGRCLVYGVVKWVYLLVFIICYNYMLYYVIIC